MTYEKTILTREEQIDLHSTIDAVVWAKEFNRVAIRLGYSSMDEGWLIGWFANAIGVGELHAQSSAGIKEAEVRGAAQARKASFLDSVSSASDRTGDRPDIIQWQKDGNQFFDATIREIVEEYAEWRDKNELKARAENADKLG